jgi:hypothetical protein
MAHLARVLFDSHHEWFLPLYNSLGTRYEDASIEGVDPNLARLVGDCGSALVHLGLYSGFLLYEVGCAVYRTAKGALADWKNPLLILTVGVVNGAGWALCQNWEWATRVFGKDAHFNFWRCWESSGGLSIGIAYGIAYFLVNRRMSDQERSVVASQRAIQVPKFEWLLVFLALTYYAYIAPLAVTVTRGQMGGQLPVRFAKLAAILPGQWATLYFVVVLLFGGVYYFVSRPLATDALAKRGRALSWLDSVIAVLLTLLLTGSLFIPEYRFVQAAQKIRLADLVLDYNRFLRHHIEHLPGIGRIFGEFQITQFALFYIELFAGGLLALSLAWYLITSKGRVEEIKTGTPAAADLNLERFGLYLGVLAGLALSIRNGLKGWFNIYCLKNDQYWTQFFLQHFGTKGDERYWSVILWHYLGPVYLLLLIALVAWILFRPMPSNFRGNPYPRAYGLIWLVLIVQNVIAQLITGPPTIWYEMAFSIYYALLFAITAVIVVHFHWLKRTQFIPASSLPESRPQGPGRRAQPPSRNTP